MLLCLVFYLLCIYVFLFWAVVSGRLTLCAPRLLSLNLNHLCLSQLAGTYNYSYRNP